MKSSIINLLALSLIVSFAAACGKKESSGGKSANPYSNGSFTGTGSAVGEAAYNNLKSWQESSTEASIVGTHLYYSKRAVSMFNKAMCQKNTVVVDCENPNGCFKHTNNGIFKGTVVMNNSTFLGMTVKKYGDCDITTSFNLYTKAGNLELKDAVLGTGKYIIKAQTQQSGSYFTVYYGSFDGATTAVSYAVINTSLPTILNPTEVGSVSNGTKIPSTKLFEFYSGN
jgi:hypothetical protein